MADATTANPNQTTQDIGSIISLIMGLTGSPDANKFAQMADPWAPNRPKYQTELNTFMDNPASIFTDPAFQAAENLGAENISRQAGAAGMAGSGNRLADLFKFGQTSGLEFEKQRFNELEDLAGVNAGSPVAAAKLLLDNLKNQGTNLTTGLSGVLPMLLQLLGIGGGSGGGGLVNVIKKMFGGGTDLSTLLDQGGINAGNLDVGGTLGDLESGTTGDSGLLDNFFTGGSGDVFQMIDVLGG